MKSVPSLLEKTLYLHYLNLKLFLEEGMILNEIFEVVEFHQEKALASYIQENTVKRKAAKTLEEKNFRKLLNNQVFGRTIMNRRNHGKTTIVTSQAEFKRETQKTTFERYSPYTEKVFNRHMQQAH